jgi:hypothetical protein
VLKFLCCAMKDSAKILEGHINATVSRDTLEEIVKRTSKSAYRIHARTMEHVMTALMNTGKENEMQHIALRTHDSCEDLVVRSIFSILFLPDVNVLKGTRESTAKRKSMVRLFIRT